ncbi:hypothetical protein NKI38_31800 [Mesorhizobium sp. M0621]|uniref:hypothetical protein n=1 Tax=Mesorhizobium sp. M0621 TaxID=2956974 RepID=UPI0033374727
MTSDAAVRGAAGRQREIQRQCSSGGPIELSALNVPHESPQRAGLLAEGIAEGVA